MYLTDHRYIFDDGQDRTSFFFSQIDWSDCQGDGITVREQDAEGERIKLVLAYPEWTHILFRYLAYGDRADEASFDPTFLRRAQSLGKEVPEGLE